MKQIGSTYLVVFLFLSLSCTERSISTVYQDPTEGRLLLGATVHLGDGEVIENAALGIKDGVVTLLTKEEGTDIDLKKFELDKLGADYHIYPFKKAEAGNSGIVLARANAEPINISIRDREEKKSIAIGTKAQLLICFGSIQDASKFRVDYVVTGKDKVKILRQSDYGDSIISKKNN